jgi:hypothetical protein
LIILSHIILMSLFSPFVNITCWWGAVAMPLAVNHLTSRSRYFALPAYSGPWQKELGNTGAEVGGDKVIFPFLRVEVSAIETGSGRSSDSQQWV